METLTHYHRVETALWFDMARRLQRLCVAIVGRSQVPVSALFDVSDVEDILLFLDEMAVGYLHPRRTSRRVSLSPIGRRAAAICSAYPLTNKT